MLAVLLIPLSLMFFFGLLALADALERRTSLLLVRSSLRSPLSCEETEAVIAANLAPCLEAAGLGREVVDPDPDPDGGASAAERRAADAVAVVLAAPAEVA